MKAQLLYYPSSLNDQLQPLPVCATDPSPEPKSLILDLSPGAIADLSGAVERCQQLATWAAKEGGQCVVAKPCGIGPGSVYQGPAEIDRAATCSVWARLNQTTCWRALVGTSPWSSAATRCWSGGSSTMRGSWREGPLLGCAWGEARRLTTC